MRRALRLLVPLLLVLLPGLFVGGPAHAQATADNLEVMLAIDTSGSMRPAMESAKAAARGFVAAMPADVRIGLATFDDDVAVLTPPTTDRGLLNAQIDGIAAGGDTALYDALVTASQHFTAAAEYEVLVLLSDGRDDGSTATLQDAVVAVQGDHVEAISLTTAETDLASLSVLGAVTPADDAAAVSAAFLRVADLLTEAVAPTTTTTAAPATTVYSRPPAPAASASASAATGPSDSLWLGAGGLFIGLFAVALLVFPQQRVSKARLGIHKPRSVSDMGKRTTSAVEEALERHGRRADIASTLSVAGISMSPGEFIGMVGIVSVVLGLVGSLVGGPVVGVLVAAVVCLLVRLHVRRTKLKRQGSFADQLPDVMQLVTTGLRSGYGIVQALESVAEDAEEPARSEFAHVLVESRLGRDLSEAMRALAQRMQNKDLEWVVSAIDINRETGGNLSEILSTVSVTIRERQRMARHVRALTAEGRMSARILTVLPLAIALWSWRSNPESFTLLTYGIGLIATVFAGILMVTGTVWVRKIVNSVVS